MTIFFIFTLTLSLLIVLILAYLIFKRLEVNREMQNKYAISYLTPLLLTIFLMFFIIRDTQLRVVDTINILNDNTASIEIKHSNYSVRGNCIQTNYGDYILSPITKIDIDRDYRVVYAPMSHVVLDIELIGKGSRER